MPLNDTPWMIERRGKRLRITGSTGIEYYRGDVSIALLGLAQRMQKIIQLEEEAVVLNAEIKRLKARAGEA